MDETSEPGTEVQPGEPAKKKKRRKLNSGEKRARRERIELLQGQLDLARFKGKLPGLLLRIYDWIEDPNTSPAVRVQLLLSIDRIASMIPEAKGEQKAADTKVLDRVLQELLRVGAGTVRADVETEVASNEAAFDGDEGLSLVELPPTSDGTDSQSTEVDEEDDGSDGSNSGWAKRDPEVY